MEKDESFRKKPKPCSPSLPACLILQVKQKLDRQTNKQPKPKLSEKVCVLWLKCATRKNKGCKNTGNGIPLVPTSPGDTAHKEPKPAAARQCFCRPSRYHLGPNYLYTISNC